MSLWPSQEEKDARKAVIDAAVKRRKNRCGDIKEMAEELGRKYDVVIETRSKFREARETLEDLEAQAKVDQASGQQSPNLDQAKKTVEKARALLQALEEQLRITERRTKQKYPNIFRFL